MDKKISIGKLIRLVPAFIGLVLVGVGLFVALPIMSGNSKAAEIALNGTVGEDVNVKMYDGNVRVNSESLYYLTFTYVDQSGVTRQGKTRTTYSALEASRAVLAGKLEIRYNQNGAINADFDEVEANKGPKIVLLVFGFVGAFLVAISLFGGMATRGKAVIERDGVDASGVVEGIVGGLSVMGIEYFAVKVGYTNQRGEYVVGKTEHSYKSDIHERLFVGDSVDIRYYGKSVLIKNLPAVMNSGEGFESCEDGESFAPDEN